MAWKKVVFADELPGLVGYVHAQAAPSAHWTVAHNLGFVPNVTVVDSGGNVVEGDVAHPSVNQTELQFSAAFGGTAYLS